MVALNSRLSPHFERRLPPSWLPERPLWRAVIVAYGALGAGHVLFGNLWVGVACALVAAAASPRVRAMVMRAYRSRGPRDAGRRAGSRRADPRRTGLRGADFS